MISSVRETLESVGEASGLKPVIEAWEVELEELEQEKTRLLAMDPDDDAVSDEVKVSLLSPPTRRTRSRRLTCSCRLRV
jgi:hypothetical protein